MSDPPPLSGGSKLNNSTCDVEKTNAAPPGFSSKIFQPDIVYGWDGVWLWIGVGWVVFVCVGWMKLGRIHTNSRH